MATKQFIEESHSAEPTLEEEFRSLSDDDLIEFMNLTEEDTGIEGTIFLSTVVGQHGPRVKYYVKAGKHQPSFSVSIGANPRVLASSLPQRIVGRAAPLVIEWVKLNREALLQFWNEGETWPVRQLAAFAERLTKLPRN